MIHYLREAYWVDFTQALEPDTYSVATEGAGCKSASRAVVATSKVASLFS
ncbi:MAG: hypothetical protein QW828_06275 [Candidatus Bathyarchaeia archaeon]